MLPIVPASEEPPRSPSASSNPQPEGCGSGAPGCVHPFRQRLNGGCLSPATGRRRVSRFGSSWKPARISTPTVPEVCSDEERMDEDSDIESRQDAMRRWSSDCSISANASNLRTRTPLQGWSPLNHRRGRDVARDEEEAGSTLFPSADMSPPRRHSADAELGRPKAARELHDSAIDEADMIGDDDENDIDNNAGCHNNNFSVPLPILRSSSSVSSIRSVGCISPQPLSASSSFCSNSDLDSLGSGSASGKSSRRHSVSFADEVETNYTHGKEEYIRQNPLLRILSDGEAAAAQAELARFKKNEMRVHPLSRHNTHLYSRNN